MTDRAARKLFAPIQIGPLALSHRVVMGPLTRSRSEQPGDIPGNLMVEYYKQRASEGGLIISGSLGGEIASRLAYTQKSEGQNLPGRPVLKSEGRMSKPERISNVEITPSCRRHPASSGFGLPSGFGIRASDFSIASW